MRPIDPSSDDGALSLRSFIWADQLGRLSRLDGAIEIARAMPLDVERIDAATFLERELDEPRPDMATVVYHSVFVQYLTEGSRRRITAAIDEAVSRATPDAPVYHLRMEPAGATFQVKLGVEVLATCKPHGTAVRWVANS
jgi:hypothetical protein